MDQEWAWGVIAQERRTVAELLEGLTPDQWEEPSLCSRWRVRDVAGHLAMLPQAPGPLAMTWAALRAGGNFHKLNERMAVHHARHEPSELVAQLREHAESRSIPVVSSPSNVLFDILVHGQDIAMPLGLPHRMDVEAARAGAERVWAMGWPFHAQRRFRGLRLVADDVEWSAGSGAEVVGPASALLLALTGRPAAVPELRGDGAAILAARLAPVGAANHG